MTTRRPRAFDCPPGITHNAGTGARTMADVTRQAAPDAAGSGDRDATTEALLLAGLDDYFAGRYERAIHAFTRVLFLDRAHPRARAYIERARAGLAERQRETDELLHGGLEAFDRGDTDRARDLLTTAVTRGAPPELALPVLERLERLDAGRVSAEAMTLDAASAAPAEPDVPTEATSRSNRVLLAATVVLLVVAAGFAFGVARLETAREAALPPAPALAGAPSTPWPTVRPSELLLRRARLLRDRGHLHDALRTLESVGMDDPLRPQADRLVVDIQRALLDNTGPFDGAARP